MTNEGSTRQITTTTGLFVEVRVSGSRAHVVRLVNSGLGKDSLLTQGLC